MIYDFAVDVLRLRYLGHSTNHLAVIARQQLIERFSFIGIFSTDFTESVAE